MTKTLANRTAALGCAAALLLPGAAAGSECVPVASWVDPGQAPAAVPGPDMIARLARRNVVLLGESHDNADHHRWQLQTLAGLHALRPDMVMAVEMFPRRVQKTLDKWVKGELTEEKFLAESEWSKVWGFDPQLYLPLFHFARINRLPMLAINVDDATMRAVREKGFDAVSESDREGVGRPAPGSEAYEKWLLPIFQEHEKSGHGSKDKADHDDPEFRKFIGSQTFWDRAMAEPIAAMAKRVPAPLVVGIVGQGHAIYGHGIPHQLAGLGIRDVAVALPWDRDDDCGELRAGIADAAFGMPTTGKKPHAGRPKLGISMEPAEEGVRIRAVMKGSVAEAAGIKENDLVIEMASRRVRKMEDLRSAVQRQAPGTWLPIRVRRGDAEVDIVAKFPPEKD